MATDDFTLLAAANALVTARSPEGLGDETYRELYIDLLRTHGVKIVDALVVLARLLAKDAAEANDVTVDEMFQHYGIQFKSLESVDTT